MYSLFNPDSEYELFWAKSRCFAMSKYTTGLLWSSLLSILYLVLKFQHNAVILMILLFALILVKRLHSF